MSFWSWFGVGILVLIVVYIASYFVYPKHVDIMQSSLHNFSFDMLREKQPIVIDDRVASLSDLGQIWFKHNIVTTFSLEGSQQWNKNQFKYAILQAEQEGDIYLYQRGKQMTKDGVPNPEEKLLAIHLLPGQLLIVPYLWHYLVAEPMRVSALGVHDYITYFGK